MYRYIFALVVLILLAYFAYELSEGLKAAAACLDPLLPAAERLAKDCPKK